MTYSDSTGVAYVANSSKIGGGNRVLMDLIGGLDRRRFAPTLVAPADGPLVEWAESRDVPCRVIPDGDQAGRIALVRRAAMMAPALVRAHAQIVHAIDPSCYRAAGLAGLIAGASCVCHVEFPIGPGEADWNFRFGPDLVITCYEGQARETAERLRSIKPECRVVAVPNAVDTDVFTVPADPRSARERWSFGARHVALIVGHLSEVKGYPTFLRAAAKTAAGLDDCAFLLLGGETIQPGYGSYLAELARDLGIGSQVHFLGWRPDVANVIQAADVVVLPSLAEGLPLSILEAMACGKPVIATPVNGVPEAVTDGLTGLLVPPNDPDALAAAMRRVLIDPQEARRMGEQGRQVATANFSVREFIPRVEALYDDLQRRADYRHCSSIIL